VYHPGEPEPAFQAAPALRTLSLDDLAAQRGDEESPSLLHRVAQRRAGIVTVMVTIAALSSFGGTVYWAHKQDIDRGGPGLPIPMVKPADGPSKVKPDDPKGQPIPNQDIDAYRRVDPQAVPVPAERLMPPPATPRAPAAAAPQATPAPSPAPSISDTPSTVAGAPSTPAPAAPATASAPPPVTSTAPPASEATAPKISDTGSGPTVATLVDSLSGPAAGGGYRIQLASEKSEDSAKASWARLQKSHGDVLGNLRMQPGRVDLGDKGVWYRVQAGPLEEKQAKDACAKLKARNTACVLLPPAR
jgi:hypothetical protein